MNRNNGEVVYNVGLTEAELTELVTLIDDGDVDELFLVGIRRKLVHKRKMVRRKKSKMMAALPEYSR